MPMHLVEELKRRNVIRVGLAYGVSAWVLLQLADILLEAFSAPAWNLRIVLVLLLIGFPLALLFAWVYELTPEGLRRESEVDPARSVVHHTSRRLDRAIIVILAVALGFFAVDKFVLRDEGGPPAPANEAEMASADVESPNSGAEADAPSVALTIPSDRSIAVMPFEHPGGREEDSVFAAGMHNDLLTQLAQIDALRVIARTSVARFRDSDLPVREVATALNAATLLEGNIQTAGHRVRISLQLVDAATETYLWAETFDRDLTTENVFDIQSEIAREVTTALEATLSEGERERLAQRPTDDLQALELYFQAQAELDKRNPENIETARQAFRTARERDPDFAQAWAGEAKALLLSGTYSPMQRAQAVAQAEPLLERALELAPQDPQVLAVKGFSFALVYRGAEALPWYEKSLARNPSDGEVASWMARSLSLTGAVGSERVYDLLREAVRLDPASEIALLNAIIYEGRRRDPDQAFIQEQQERLERLNPGKCAYTRGLLAEYAGDKVEAIRQYYASIQLDPELYPNRIALATLLLELGLNEEADRVAPRLPPGYRPFVQGDWPGLVASAQRSLEENAEDPDTLAVLARGLLGTGQVEQALQIGLITWERMGKNPWSWGPGSLADMAWGLEQVERLELAGEFTHYARQVLDHLESVGVLHPLFYTDRAKVELIENRQEAAIASLAKAIDRGYRRPAELRTPIWDALQDKLGFRQQLDRLEELIAQERGQVQDLLCDTENPLAGRPPAPGTCSSG